jgi:2-haloacid dehalogenase
MNKKYTTLLMDVDNTLLDFDEAEHRGIREVMRAFGIEPTEEREVLYKRINRTHWEAFERGDITRDQIFERRYPRFFSEFGIQVDPEKAETLYRAQLDSCSALIDGALELCQYLKPRYDLYIITNGVSTTQYRRLKDSTLDQYFTGIFVSEDAGSQKPRKEFFDYCLPRITEKDLTRMLVIGDSLTSDIQGGLNTGIDTCWFNRTSATPSPTIHPTYEVHSLAELQKLL